jgi:DnaJ family protein C protein 7
VDELRGKGNDLFKAGCYADARLQYSAALDMQPGHAGLLSNRAAASMMLGEWQQAYEDASEAVKLEPSNSKAHERCARCLLLLGRLEDGARFCNKRIQALDLFECRRPEWQPLLITAQRISNCEALFNDVENRHQKSGSGTTVAKASVLVERILEIKGSLSELENRSSLGRRLRLALLQAWLHPLSDDTRRAVDVSMQWASDALQEIQRWGQEATADPEVFYWKARCLLRQGRRADARAALKETMQLVKGDLRQEAVTEELLDCLRQAESQKSLGNEAFKCHRWDAALQHYDAAVQADRHHHDPSFSASLFCNRGAAQHKQGQLQAALEDVNMALALNASYAKALFRRGLLYLDLERYSCAAADFDAAAEADPSFVGVHEHRQRAHHWARTPPVRNYYALLNVAYAVGEAELKRAYKVAALRWHPDKHPSEQRAFAEKRFKEVKEAFETLSDPSRRREYDGLDAVGSARWRQQSNAGQPRAHWR